MNALTDQQLLRDYAANRSESAFRELVHRHIDLVHSAALRLVNNAHTAEDVTQAVFTALAKDARKVSSHPVLAGWLHRTTRYLSTNVVRAEVRRRAREQEAIMMNAPDSEPSWRELAPHLDAVLGELSGPDRDAVILRYFEKRSAKEIGLTLGITTEAAQKRVNRAIERLRESFARRGITQTGLGIAAVISSHAVQAAPAGLAATVSRTLAGSLATTSTLFMALSPKLLVSAAALALGGAWLYQNREATRLRDGIVSLRQTQATAVSPSNDLQGRVSRGANGDVTVGAESSQDREEGGDAGGFAVAAGAMVDGEWFGPGPGPEPVALDNLGRPTTAMVENLALTDEEVAMLETAVSRVRSEAAEDFVERVKLISSGNKDDGYHYAYHAPARQDAGRRFFDALTRSFTDAIGENRGRQLREAMNEEDFLGGMGKYDLEFDFRRGPQGRVTVKCESREPGTGKVARTLQSTLESFEEDFGRIFEFPDGGGAPYPKVPIRWLPENR